MPTAYMQPSPPYLTTPRPASSGAYSRGVLNNNELAHQNYRFPPDLGHVMDAAGWANTSFARRGKTAHGLGFGPIDYEQHRLDPIGKNDLITLPMIKHNRWSDQIPKGEGYYKHSRASMASYRDQRSNKLVYVDVNKILYGRDFSQAAWVVAGTAAKTINMPNQVTFAAVNDRIEQTVTHTVVANDSMIVGGVFVGDGTIHLRVGDVGHTDFSEIQMTLDPVNPTLWYVPHAFAGGFASVKYTIILKAGDTATYVETVIGNRWDLYCQMNEGFKLCDPVRNDGTILDAKPRVEDFKEDDHYRDVGVLIEGPSENLWDHAEETDNAAFTKNNSSITADQEWTPEHYDTQSMDELVEASDVAQIHEITRQVTVTAGGRVCYSAFVKENTRRYCRLELHNATDGIEGYAEFDLQTHTLLASGGAAFLGAGVPHIIPDDTDPINKTDTCRIYCAATFVTGTETVMTCKLILQDTAGNSTYNGDGVSSIFVWGHQVEETKYPSSYIPTDQNTYARAVEVFDYYVSGADIHDGNANDYSLSIEAAVNHIRADGVSGQMPFRFNNQANRRISMVPGSGGNAFAQHFNSATYGAVPPTRDRVQYTMTKNASTLAAFLHGKQTGSNTPGTYTGSLNTIRFGSWGNPSLDGWIKTFRYQDKEITDAADARGLLTAGASTYMATPPMAKAVGGVVGAGFGDIWYNNYHIIPDPLNVGNLVASVSKTVEVWNAYFTSKLLSAINVSGGDGIVISGGITPPDTFGPLESAIYTFDISQEGPAVIDADYQFVFPDSSPVLDIIGNRTINFHFPYDRGVVETLEWRTDIIPTIEGEQARKLRYAPRQGIKAQYVLLDDEQTLADSRLYGWSEKVFTVPLLWEAQIIGDHLTGATTIACDPSLARLLVDTGAVIWKSMDYFEDISITAVNANDIEIANALTKDFTGGGILLMPTRSAYLAGKPSKSRRDGDYASYSITWRILDNFPPPAWSGTVYQSLDVLEEPLISDKAISESIYKPVEWVDNNIGIFKPYPLKNFTPESRSLSHHMDGLAELQDWYKFLGNRSGRYQPFWYPSFRNDFKLTNPIGTADTTIQIKDIEYELYEDGTTRHIALWLKDGTRFYKQVTDIRATQLDIDTQFGQVINEEDIFFFGWLHLLRLNADRIQIKHDGQWSTCSLPTMTTV